jgi:hypothetical protein
LVRAEFQRLDGFDRKFDWTHAGPPATEAIPKAPTVGQTFLNTVAAVDWRLTDQYENDESLFSIITVADLCDTLQRYHAMVEEDLAKAEAAPTPIAARQPVHHAVESAINYDNEVDQFLYVVNDALRDLERRLAEARVRQQVRRLVTRLPRGENPAPVTPDDPRVKEFASERARRKALPGAQP